MIDTSKLIKIKPREHYCTTHEIKRALKFLFGQLRRGWTSQEAFEQIRNTYGVCIKYSVWYYLQEYFKNHPARRER